MNQATNTNYFNNKEVLLEIHKSKLSYCEFDDPKYRDYDVIVENKDDLVDDKKFPDILIKAKENRAARIAVQNHEAAQKKSKEKLRLKDFKFDPTTIPDTDIVIRVHTWEHIPKLEGKKKGKKEGSDKVRLNFVPFKHYILTKKGNLKEVGRSHYKNGEFCVDGGSMTPRLAELFMLMVNKIASRGNWRGYSYIDEMRGQALLQLSHMGLHFNEARSDLAFSYYTDIVWHSFTRVLNTERKNQKVRDEIMIDQGQLPSFSRQLQHEEEVKRAREEAASSEDLE